MSFKFSILGTAAAICVATSALIGSSGSVRAQQIHVVDRDDPAEAKQRSELDAVKQAAIGQLGAVMMEKNGAMQAEQYRLARIQAELEAATTPAEIGNIVNGLETVYAAEPFASSVGADVSKSYARQGQQYLTETEQLVALVSIQNTLKSIEAELAASHQAASTSK
jgi:hypothetical protein